MRFVRVLCLLLLVGVLAGCAGNPSVKGLDGIPVTPTPEMEEDSTNHKLDRQWEEQHWLPLTTILKRGSILLQTPSGLEWRAQLPPKQEMVRAVVTVETLEDSAAGWVIFDFLTPCSTQEWWDAQDLMLYDVVYELLGQQNYGAIFKDEHRVVFYYGSEEKIPDDIVPVLLSPPRLDISGYE